MKLTKEIIVPLRDALHAQIDAAAVACDTNPKDDTSIGFLHESTDALCDAALAHLSAAPEATLRLKSGTSTSNDRRTGTASRSLWDRTERRKPAPLDSEGLAAWIAE